MSDLANPSHPKPRKPPKIRKPPKMKKTGKLSPFFPQPPTKSPYFKVHRRPRRGRDGRIKGRAQGREVSKKHREGEVGEPDHHLKDMVSRPLENGPITERRLLERAVDCRDDGWMTEFEPHHDGITTKTNQEGKRRRKGRKRSKKSKLKAPKGESLDKSSKNMIDGVGILVAPGFAEFLDEGVIETAIESCSGNGNQTGQDLTPKYGLEKGGFEVVIERRRLGLELDGIEAADPDAKKKKKKKKKKKRTKDRQLTPEIHETSMPAKEAGPFDQVPYPSKKRKRSTTFEIVITAPGTPLLQPSSGTSLEALSIQPGVEHRKTGENNRKRTKVMNESWALEEDTLEGRISRWFKNNPYPGGIDAHKKKASTKNQSSCETTDSHSAAANPEGKQLRVVDHNVWPEKAGAPDGGTLPSKKGPLILPPQVATQDINFPPSDDTPGPTGVLSRGKTEATLNLVPESPAVTPGRRARSKIKTGKVSKYFASSAKEIRPARAKKSSKNKRVPAGTSIIPWPPLSAETFGLVQEELRSNTFHVIIATTFLNKTRGSVAVPLLRQFLTEYPTPLILSQGDRQTITDFLQPLGLHRTRAKRLIAMAKAWIASPPTPERGVKKYNYPARDTVPFNFAASSGNDCGPDKRPKLGVEEGLEWEIAHLPGVGAYALDSWRIFCRDEFRRSAVSSNMVGEKGKEEQVEQEEEWRRVVPKDKELRAYLRWRWAKEGMRWREAGDIEVEVVDETGGKVLDI